MVLTSGKALLAMTLLATTSVGATTGCQAPTPPAPDPLEAQAQAARNDSALATAAAAAATPALAAVLTEIATERSEHAIALLEDINPHNRDNPDNANQVNTTPTGPTTATDPQTPPPTMADVITALQQSARSATELAPTLSGYRAGLLSSIAAACITAYTVALGDPTPIPPIPAPAPLPIPASTVSTQHQRPAQPDHAALFEALATEHGVIYAYGNVSAYCAPESNALVSEALTQHRQRREAALAALASRDAATPLPASGYHLPQVVDSPDTAATLAIDIENDSARIWRVAIEHATTGDDRTLGLIALTQSAVLAARWKQTLTMTPLLVAFPGGNS